MMHPTRPTALLPLLAFALASCGGPGVKSETNRPGALAAARAFGVRQAVVAAGPAFRTAPDPIAAAVTAEMKARGLTEKDGAELEGAARVVVKGQLAVYARFGPRAAFPAMDRQQTWGEGTLVVEFYSARTTDLVWRGVAEGLVKDGVTAEEIRSAVAEMFKDWPSAG